MRRMLALFAIVLLICCVFVGCKTEEEQHVVATHIMFNNTEVKLGAVYDSTLAEALGKVAGTEEISSCHYDGVDTIYRYGDHLQIYTYLSEGKNVMYTLKIGNDRIKTAEGAYVGMTYEQIVELYGEEYTELPNGISYPLPVEKQHLIFRMKDDVVTYIEYYAE